MSDAWERHAGWWQREFTEGADVEYEEQIVPIVERELAGATRVVDVGCGEGQLARRLATSGAHVLGVDSSRAQLRVAGARDGGPVYVMGSADRLPVASAAVDGVVACLVFEHLDDLERPITEIARVLVTGGRFLLLLNHPLLQAPGSGWIDDQVLEEQYWRVGPYLPASTTDEEVAPGVVLPFVHRPLSDYVNAMVDHGLVVERMEEPPPPPGFLAAAPEYREAASIPRLLVLRARRAR